MLMVKQIQYLSYWFSVTFKIPPTEISSCGSEANDQMGIKLTWWGWLRKKNSLATSHSRLNSWNWGICSSCSVQAKAQTYLYYKCTRFLSLEQMDDEKTNLFFMLDTFLFDSVCWVQCGILGWGSSVGIHAWFQLWTDWTQVWDSKWHRQSGRSVCTVDKSVFSKPPLFWHLKFWCICGNFWAPGMLICSPENIWDVTL